jgi:ATP-dependent Clp protease ATP-binding subunit ClpA
MLSRQLEVSLRLAVSMARQKRHEFLTVEHLLLALLDNDSAVNALKACGADIIVLRKELEEYVEQHTPKLGENSDQARIQPKVLTVSYNVQFSMCNQAVVIGRLKAQTF